MDDTVTSQDLNDLLEIFGSNENLNQVVQRTNITDLKHNLNSSANQFRRESKYLQHPVFNSYQSEALLVRYMKMLENKDISLVHSMIPLGSCTMKLNATTELIVN